MASAAVVLITLVLGLRAAVLFGEAAAGTTAVELDTVTLAGDTVALAVALGVRVADGRDGRRRRRARGARRHGSNGAGRAVGVRVLIGQTRAGEAAGQVVNGGSEVSLAQLTRSVVLGGLGVLDARGGQGAASSDAAGSLGGGAGLATGNIEDVELAAGGGLDGVLDGGVVGHVVAVHDVVVPVAASELEHGGLEAELSLPGAGLLVSGEGNLALVAVPRTDEVDGLDVGRGAERELELNGRHDE